MDKNILILSHTPFSNTGSQFPSLVARGAHYITNERNTSSVLTGCINSPHANKYRQLVAIFWSQMFSHALLAYEREKPLWPTPLDLLFQLQLHIYQ